MTARWLRQVALLIGPGRDPSPTDVLIAADGAIAAIGQEVAARAADLGLEPVDAAGLLLAPALIDPHSLLEDPSNGPAETLHSLERSAVAAGYGTVALLPQASRWRDGPDAFGLPPLRTGLQVPLWGSLSSAGAGEDLAAHADQLEAGAIGLAHAATTPPLPLLERALALAEMGDAPVLLAPRDRALSQQGFVRESIEALRAGWPADPALSETLPLQALLALARLYPQRRLRLMNISTAEAVALLAGLPPAERPLASVSWWHLLADSGSLDPTAEGWRLEPPLGSPADRRVLRDGLASGVLTAVAVHHLALDPEEQLLPLDQRKPGVAGHRFVLPCLWQELVVGAGWHVAQLWQALCFGPAELLGIEPPELEVGSRAWLLFDPEHPWSARQDADAPQAANQPLADAELCGQVVAVGLNPRLWRGPGSLRVAGDQGC